ncbi:MAG: NADH-quinone oxidoreductase subunit NuoK [Gammaproteobacteria bacterium]|nr:NADH-quinone oxidoreductase subunit NuoK [Gammaproteobacteria bacterium]
MDDTTLLLGLAALLFAIGLVGIIVRHNLLVMLMFLELMLNGVLLSLAVFTAHTGAAAGAVLIFLAFVVAAAEVAVAVPLVVLLARRRRSLDPSAYMELRG